MGYKRGVITTNILYESIEEEIKRAYIKQLREIVIGIDTCR